MFEIKSTMTSKGQITLPKTIRDVMNLNTGEQVKFSIQENKKVVMEKDIHNVKLQPLANLIPLLQKEIPLILIQGEVGCGKSYFAKSLLISQFNSSKVVIIEPYGEYKHLEEYSKNLTCITTSERDGIFPNIEQENYEIIVIDEAYSIDFDLIKEINQIKHKMILISQTFEQEEILELGTHISITFNRNRILVEHRELVDNEFNISPIYVG